MLGVALLAGGGSGTDLLPAGSAPPAVAGAGAGAGGCAEALASVKPEDSGPPALTRKGVEEVAGRVERIRDLRFGAPVDATFLSREGIARRVSNLVDRGYPRELADRQAAALIALGALPPDTDLLRLSRRALASQVVGLFVPETKELLVGRSGSAGAVEEITLAHEVEHALAFDAVGFPLPERTRPGRGDRDLAVQSLIEGDATLTMQLYAQRHVSLGRQLDVADDPEIASGSDDLSKLPDFLRRQLLFPYEAGLQFVCDRYASGGWKAVDRAYRKPPRSTSELLGLDSDLGAPVDPPATGRPPKPWRRRLSDQLGAAELAWLFAAPGGDPDRALPEPRAAISGWAGGRVTLWQRGDASAVGVSLVDRGSGSLCGATVAFYGAAFPRATLSRSGEVTTFAGPDQDAAVSCSGETIQLGIAPRAEIAERIATG